MKNIYENLYSDEKNSGNLAKDVRIKKMLSIINGLNLHDKNILDMGCHDGTLISLIKNRDNHFFGLEASKWAIEQCRKKNINVQQFYFDDKSQLPYDDNFFDIIIAGEIIEHIYDTDFFLEEILRILKPGGHLLVSTPNLASLGRRIFLLMGRSPIIELSPNEPTSCGHIRYFTLETLGNLLEKHSFRKIISKSDVINLSSDGKLRLFWLAKIFPSLGASIIYLGKKP